VEFIDASVMAQLGIPDMKLPILYSLSYPQRFPLENCRLELTRLKNLEFYPVDRDKFTSLAMAERVLLEGKNAGAVLNAANEVAVEYFLKEKITFNDIFSVVETIFYHENFVRVTTVQEVQETIEQTKQKTREYLKKISKP